jgi:hypothetical protein
MKSFEGIYIGENRDTLCRRFDTRCRIHGKEASSGFAFALGCAAVILIAGAARAACTEEEARQKVIQLNTQLQVLAQKDADTFRQRMQEFQQLYAAFRNTTDPDTLCTYYDEMLAKTK